MTREARIDKANPRPKVSLERGISSASPRLRVRLEPGGSRGAAVTRRQLTYSSTVCVQFAVRRVSATCVIFHASPTFTSMNASIPQCENVPLRWKV